MAGVINLGFYNYATIDSIVAVLNYKLLVSRTIVKTARQERPRSVMDVTMGRKAKSLVVLTGDRFIISSLPAKTLAKRLGAVIENTESEGEGTDLPTDRDTSSD